jgi:D-xylose transport system substrate-binding protein
VDNHFKIAAENSDFDQRFNLNFRGTANTGTAGALVELAHDAGVKVIGYDSMLQGGPLDVMVMQDSWKVGRLQGEALVSWLQESKGEVSGNVALIRGQPGDSNAEALSSGVLDVIDSYPALELIADRSHVDWSPDLARETATTLLVEYDNKVDAFVANNSGMAFGVIAALNEEGIAASNKVFVAGSDADLRNIRLIAQDVQVMDVWKQIKPLAFAAADLAIKVGNAPDSEITDLIGEHELVHNGYADIPTIITPVVAISKDNIEETLIADGFYTAEQVYNQ